MRLSLVPSRQCTVFHVLRGKLLARVETLTQPRLCRPRFPARHPDGHRALDADGVFKTEFGETAAKRRVIAVTCAGEHNSPAD